MLLGWFMPPGADRRLVACAGYALQAGGCIALMLAGGTNIVLLLAGVVLFGLGFGNATSLPPRSCNALPLPVPERPAALRPHHSAKR